MAGQMPRSGGRAPISRRRARPASNRRPRGAAAGTRSMSGTGTMTCRSSRGGAEASTISTGRSPPRKRATSSSGRDGGRQADALRVAARTASARRSSDSARWAPRLVGASAWISSTITVCDRAQGLARLRAEQQEQRLGRGDQDLGRVLGLARGARCGVSPVRTSTRGGAQRLARAARRPAAMPTSGARRLRSTS